MLTAKRVALVERRFALAPTDLNCGVDREEAVASVDEARALPLGFNLLGDGLRDAIDPRVKNRF